MSKTLGNVIDPLDVMEKFGTDALRFTLLTGSTPGNDMNLSLQHVEANRNFANKLWNASRLVLMALEKAPAKPKASVESTVADRWIEARLATLLRDVDRLFEAYQYGEAGRQIYEFFWSEFADWYLEIAKLQLKENGDRAWLTARTMIAVLDTCLRLLHPFTPFVTEELWGRLRDACKSHPAAFGPKDGWEKALIVARWPEPGIEAVEETGLVDRFTLLMELVRTIRNIRAERGVESKSRIPAIICGGEMTDFVAAQRRMIAALARLDLDHLKIHTSLEEPPSNSVPLVVGSIEAYLPLEGLVDPAVERGRLTEELEEARSQIERLEALLSGAFSEKAPKEIVRKERDKLESLRQAADKLLRQLDALE
jgi:valyl-tRNA synthetase